MELLNPPTNSLSPTFFGGFKVQLVKSPYYKYITIYNFEWYVISANYYTWLNCYIYLKKWTLKWYAMLNIHLAGVKYYFS